MLVVPVLVEPELVYALPLRRPVGPVRLLRPLVVGQRGLPVPGGPVRRPLAVVLPPPPAVGLRPIGLGG